MTTNNLCIEEVKLHYFIPKNREQLIELVGKPVGTLMYGQFQRPMIYAGIVQELPEFVEQQHGVCSVIKTPFLTKNIRGLLILTDFDFRREGINITSLRTNLYKPGTDEHRQRQQWLKQWDLWREII